MKSIAKFVLEQNIWVMIIVVVSLVMDTVKWRQGQTRMYKLGSPLSFSELAPCISSTKILT